MYWIRDTEINRILETGRHSLTIKAAVDSLYSLLSPDLECSRDEFTMDDVCFFGYSIEEESEEENE